MGKKKPKDEEVVVVDELAEFLAEDPTFGGLREDAPLEIAHGKVVAALKELHQRRFRHAAPADDLLLFDELADEIDLPDETLIRKLIAHRKEKFPITPKEERAILKAANSFGKKTKKLTS